MSQSGLTVPAYASSLARTLGGMTPITSRLTTLLKFGPFALAALVVVLAAYFLPAAPTDSVSILSMWWPITLAIFFFGFHYFTALQLADEVLDGSDRLLVRCGGRSVEVPLHSIADIREGLIYRAWLGETRREIVIEVEQRTPFGKRIHFIPGSSQLPAAYKRVGLLNHLKLRVQRARANAA